MSEPNRKNPGDLHARSAAPGTEATRVRGPFLDPAPQKEELFYRARRLETIGLLAGGVAHDFGNLLTAILGYSRIAMDQCESEGPVYDALQEIVHAAERAGRLTAQLLSFGRSAQGEARPIDINAVVEDTDRLLRRVLGEHIEIVTCLGERLGGVLIDPGLLQQVILNLGINARDAMPEGGKLTMQTSRAVLEGDSCRCRTGLEPGDYVCLAVSDTGGGMSPETLNHLFDPFYTTKEAGKGYGMGMATVREIIRSAGGWIDIDSRPDEGTRATCYFPRHDDMAVELLAYGEGRPSLPGGRETILVVEDDPSVRYLAVQHLKSLGYHVLEADNGSDALAVFESCGRPIDLVLTDVVMPLLGGRDLLRKLKRGKKRFKAMYMSGFADPVGARCRGTEHVPLLEKPFTRETLAFAVRRVLDETD